MTMGRVLLAAWFASFAAMANAQASQPLRVGFVCPLSGGSQEFGHSARLGAELAVKEINEVGGYLGRQLELVTRDDKGDPDEGRRQAEDLVLKQKVDFTVGYCNTGVALKSLDVFQDHKHLLVVPVATGSAVTAKYPADKSFVFRMSARDTLQAAFLVDEIVKRGYTRVAVFADATGYGEGGLKDVEKFLAEKQLKPVYTARFDLGVRRLTEQVQQARAAGAEVILGYTLGAELAVLAEARAQARFEGPLYGPWTLSFRTLPERAGPAVEGAMMVQTIIQDLANERRASFLVRLKRHAGTQPLGSLMAAAQTYDAVHLMMRVVFQTRGNTSADVLKQALENLERPYPGVVTSYDRPFSAADHDAFSRNMIWLGVWRKGEIQFYHADDAKRASFIRRKES
ncbi:ABC transporter substrate-binding protein [Caldimonas brevitalea]|uniref:Branched-chain amino acid transport system substrate-binding protein n=1 Tax=Caldimonas brevitalea TaxID=413882 RepID=A0A0G3BKV3_9BURK|nr:ABC transporter substrate-binding protein [Caldimonas brevitalea]AKJ27170.1 branched-chain amino acid transport system substrate-binding protein [Caldimonas brevitalea]